MSDCSLRSGNALRGYSLAIRVAIPDDVALARFDGHSPESRAVGAGNKILSSFHATPMVLLDGKWTKRHDLAAYDAIRDWTPVLEAEGYVSTESHGFVDYAANAANLTQAPDGTWLLN